MDLGSVLMLKYQWQKKWCWTISFTREVSMRGWKKLIAINQKPRPPKSAIPDLEISERQHAGTWRWIGWWCWVLKRQKWQRFERVMLWLAYWSGYYYRDSVQNWRRSCCVLEVTKKWVFQEYTRLLQKVWKVMKANANATICLVAARLKHKRYSRPLRNYGWLKIKKSRVSYRTVVSARDTATQYRTIGLVT